MKYAGVITMNGSLKFISKKTKIIYFLLVFCNCADSLTKPLKIDVNNCSFYSAKYMTDIANGDICVAVGYSGSFYQFGNRAKEAGNGVKVDWRIPKEGAPIWYDSFAIPKDAKNIDAAYAFINYLLEPEVIAKASNFLGYPNPNLSSKPLLIADIRDNLHLVPTEEQIKGLYTLNHIPRNAERARTRAWNKIKSGL